MKDYLQKEFLKMKDFKKGRRKKKKKGIYDQIHAMKRKKICEESL